MRLLFFQTHYRQPVDFNDDALAGAAEGVKRLGEFRERLARESQKQVKDEPLGKIASLVESEVRSALNDDLNAPQALAKLFDFVRAANRELDQNAGGAKAALDVLDRIMGVLDVLPTGRAVDPALASWVAEHVAARNQARKSKDFKAADAIRAELLARGVEIEDTPQGTKWRLR